MATSSSLRLSTPIVPLPIHPWTPVSKASVRLKPASFSSISIKRLPIKAAASSSFLDSISAQSIEELPSKLEEIVKQFQSVEDSNAKYKQLLFYGRNLASLEAKFKIKANKVQGCVSQVWVIAYLDSDKNIHFQADSDSDLTKGLAALLVQGLSGQPASAILKVSPDFITLTGLQQSLTPSRNNGFLNMLKLMQTKAYELDNVETEKSGGAPLRNHGFLNMLKLMQKKAYELFNLFNIEAEKSGGVVNNEALEVGNEVESSDSSDGIDEDGVNKSELGVGLGSRGLRIKEVLERELSAVELEVKDISHQHAGHAGVGSNAVETHFSVKIVSEAFEGKSSIKRHRLVYVLLQNELQSGLHALSIVAKTPSEVGGR